LEKGETFMLRSRSFLALACVGVLAGAGPSAAAESGHGSLGGVVLLEPSPDGIYYIPRKQAMPLPLKFDPGDSGFRLDRVRYDLKSRELDFRFTYTGEKVATAMATEIALMSAGDRLLSATTYTEDWADTIEYEDGRIKMFVQGYVHKSGALLRGQVQDVTGSGLPKPATAEASGLDHLRVSIPVVVFSDTSFAGSPRLARQILGPRKAEAEELAYWLARLDEMTDAAATDEEAIAGVKRMLEEMQEDTPEISKGARSARSNLRSNLSSFGARRNPMFESARAELRDLLNWYDDELEDKMRQVPVELPELPKSPPRGESRLDERLIGDGDPNDEPYCDCGGSIATTVSHFESRNCGLPWTVRETWNYVCQSDDEFGGGLSGTEQLTGTGQCLEGILCFPDVYCPPEFTGPFESEDFDNHYWNRSVSDKNMFVGFCTARCTDGPDRSISFRCPCSPRPDPVCRIDGCPILIETGTAGFRLTDLAGGVHFDLDADGVAEPLSWPVAGTDDAWLALDRDGSGTIDDGRELFGTATPQPPSSEPNGFLALAVFDRPEAGGDGDGQISAGDAVFGDLLLWLDRNHDGASDPSELATLAEAGIVAIELEYHEARRRDRYGNEFRYSAGVWHANGARRLAQDVFLLND
jgi:hypothetical protein